jgi:hypothetical protein
MQELLDVTMDLVRLVQKQAHVEVEFATQLNEPTPDFTIPFDRMSRSARRTALLVEKFLQPAKAPAAAPAVDRKFSARKQIIRAVEDAIERDAPADAVEGLHAEVRERLDSPEIEDEIGDRPDADVIAEILRDLGIAARPGVRTWKRRTPQDVARLCARAGIPRPAEGPFVLPMPPRKWDPVQPLFGPGEGRWAGDERMRGT